MWGTNRAGGLPWGNHRKDDKRASFPTSLVLSASSSAGFPSSFGYYTVAFVAVISSWPSFCALQKNFNCLVSICRIWINSLIMLCAKSIHNLGISGKNTELLKAQVDFVSTRERVDNDVSGRLISIQGAKPSWCYKSVFYKLFYTHFVYSSRWCFLTEPPSVRGAHGASFALELFVLEGRTSTEGGQKKNNDERYGKPADKPPTAKCLNLSLQ